MFEPGSRRRALFQPTDTSVPRRRKQLNDYVLESKLGTGASSVVYLGVNRVTGEKYAIKRLRLVELARTGDAVAGLEREVRLMRMFRHPNVLKLFEVLHLPAANEIYMVLEYADNGSLSDSIEQSHRLQQSTAMSIIKQIAQALQYLHSAGYVHQDIKPSNIMLTKTGRAILSDFGIGHSFVSSSMVVGSPAYQAPEALDDVYCEDSDGGETEPGSGPDKEDVWALGITLYQMLFLKLPFVGDNLFEVVNDIKLHPLNIPEGTDPLLVNLLQGMINVDPAKRFTIDDVLACPIISNADSLAKELPEGPLPKQKVGEIQVLKAVVCPEGDSFADIALSIKRRSSLHECGVTTRLSTTDAIPKIGVGMRMLDGECREHGPHQTGKRLGDGK
jgi:serine/threonine-protein kinase 11